MAIISKDTTKKQTIDLTGTQGNAFYLIGTAMKLCKELQIDDTLILNDMRSSDYEHLVNTFDTHFGDLIDLER
tara:strand:+ start:60 stop:278 length:219 start_codon:yes stop_codon:yes gene_type:complete